MSISATNRFYVYIYLDPITPGKFTYGEYEFDYEPFYVGKGTRNRKDLHIYETNGNKEKWTNQRKCERILSILESGVKPIILVCEDKLGEIEALEIEKKYIRTIETIENSGPLLNLHNTMGQVKETSDKLSKITSEYWNSDAGKEKKERASVRFKKWHEENDIAGENNPNFGNKWNDEQKEHLSKIRKESGIAKGKNNPKFKYLYKIKYQNKEMIIDSLKIFCEENQFNYASVRHITMKNNGGNYKGIFYIERINIDNI